MSTEVPNAIPIDTSDDTIPALSNLPTGPSFHSNQDIMDVDMLVDNFSTDVRSKATPNPHEYETFHLSVTRTMGNRTLPVHSQEWRSLRSQILERDDRTCASCGYACLDPMGRGMKIDHRDGDASNNDPKNLRIHCPPCEAIRHCGLHGMKGYIFLANSDLDQVEIIRKTRDLLEKNGRIPRVHEIEPLATPAAISIIEFANLLLRVDWDDLPEQMKRFRGFFTRKAQELFAITKPLRYLVSSSSVTYRTQYWHFLCDRGGGEMDSSDLRAKEILEMEASLPWIVFSPEKHGTIQGFLDTYRPSSTMQSDVAWICMSNTKIQQTDEDLSDVRGLLQAWDDLCSNSRASASELDRLARQFGVLHGKWLVFAPTHSVDLLWSKIARATYAGTLGSSAKVSPHNETETSGRHVICVFTHDYTNEAEVKKVREGLRRLGIRHTIGFKPDVYTHCGVYANNKWNIPPTPYHE